MDTELPVAPSQQKEHHAEWGSPAEVVCPAFPASDRDLMGVPLGRLILAMLPEQVASSMSLLFVTRRYGRISLVGRAGH